MTTTVRIYRSTDASAPSLNGVSGSFITLLDACLVNGYGSQTAAGWTKPFSGTNLAAYRMAAGTIGGTAQMYLRVDDTGTQNAIVVGYETMTGVSTGTNPFPSVAQATPLYLLKSVTSDATARPWILLATERTFYVITAAGLTLYGLSNSNDGGMGFGAFYSYKNGDAYNCFIKAAITAGGGNGRLGGMSPTPSAGVYATTAGFYIARVQTQLGSSYAGANCADATSGSGSGLAGYNQGGTFPDPITGGMKLSRVLVIEGDNANNSIERGFMPGFWDPIHHNPGTHMDTFNGGGELASRTFLNLVVYVTTTVGRGIFETTGSWDT